MWVRRLLNLWRSEEPVPNGSVADDLSEAQDLQAEQNRHTAFIVRHIDQVSDRVRADAKRAEDRLARR